MRAKIFAVLILIAVACTPAFGASDIFLKLDGIPGESVNARHPGEIDVLSWSWGMARPAASSGGGTAVRVSMSDLVITKMLDKATPKLMLATCDGKKIPEAILVLRKSGSEGFEYLKITMHNVYVTSVATGGSQGEDRPTESISLNLSKVEVVYTQQKADGSAGEKTTFGWDFEGNEEI
jgi:type VI secretion system secreted protein Hcp